MVNFDAMQEFHLNDSEYIRNNVDILVGAIKHKLENEEINLHHIVEGLESTLTNTNHVERALGVRFLADILQSVSASKINEKELNFLTSFFIDRLKDHHSVVPHAILGIMSLVRQTNISGEDVKNLIRNIFKEVHCQSQIMTDRRNIYNLIKFCILNKLKEMKELSTEFLLGFIGAMEGEKDPRNLVLLFYLFPQIVRALPLHTFAEDMFEVVAAYFPIDFVPPKQDPYGVLPEDLAVGLRGCLASSDAFAPHCIPLLLEKLEAESAPSKMESLLTLKACCEMYSAASMRPFSSPIWGHVRREVLEGTDAEVGREAVDAIRLLVKLLESGRQDPLVQDAITQLGTEAVVDCLPHLSSPEQRLMVLSQELLLGSAVYSHAITEVALRQVLPLLCQQFDLRKEPGARKSILGAICKFIALGARHDVLEREPFIGFQISSYKVLCQGLDSMDAGVREMALINLPSVVSALSEGQVEEIGNSLLEALFDQLNDETSRHLIVEALVSLGSANPKFIERKTVPRLLEHLYKDEDRAKLRAALESLPSLCVSVKLLKEMVPVVWGKVTSLFVQDKEGAVHFLLCARKIIEGRREIESLEFLCQEWNGMKRCQLLAFHSIASETLIDPVPLLEELSAISQCLIAGESVSSLETLVDVLLGRRSSSSIPEFESLAEVDGLRGTLLLEAVLPSPLIVFPLQGLTQLVRIDTFRNSSFVLSRLKDLALSSPQVKVRETASLLIVSHVLRIPSEKELLSYFAPLEETLLQKDPEFENEEQRSFWVRFFGWIVKGLVMRAYSGDLLWIKKLENLLLDSDVGQEATRCYEFLLEDVPALFSSAEDKPAALRLLYKQRFFVRRIEALVTQFLDAKGKGRDNTLLAISHLLPCLPQAVLKGYLQKLLPVLTQGLTSCDAVVTAGAVGTLSSLLQHSAEDVSPHVAAIIPPLISLSTSSQIMVKVKAMECLESLALHPPVTIGKLKEEVVRGLLPALDDKKRIVRKAASSARCAWVLV